jgi:HAD superfamily hydrolase (TIGR01509 family)
MKKTKIVIFDLDGALVDSAGLAKEYFQYTYPTMTDEIMDEILLGNFPEGMEKFKMTNSPREETMEEKEARSRAYSIEKLQAPLFDGMKELLKELHGKGYILAINTSALGRNCLPILDNSKVRDLFDFVGTKETAIKKVEKFKMIQEKYGVSADEMIFVTDTVGDIKEAQEAEVPTIAVTWGAHKRDYFDREKYTIIKAIVDSIAELRQTILE